MHCTAGLWLCDLRGALHALHYRPPLREEMMSRIEKTVPACLTAYALTWGPGRHGLALALEKNMDM
jgi:hypothetical protein